MQDFQRDDHDWRANRHPLLELVYVTRVSVGRDWHGQRGSLGYPF